jgi:hypothetical protein
MNYYTDFDDKHPALDPIYMPCGGTAYYDFGSGCAHRCDTCNAVIGSMGQPQRCKDEAQKWDNWEKLGGKGWDYDKGYPK